MKFSGIFLGFLLLSSLVCAQDNHGFYGKKAYVEVTSSSYIPMIYNATSQPGYKRISKESSTLVTHKSWFNVGLRTSIGYTVKSNVGIALELGFDRFNLNSKLVSSYKNPFDPSSNLYLNYHESVQINSILILPKIEIAGSNGLLPNGLVHQIGIGMTINKPANKEYATSVDEYYYQWEDVPPSYDPELGEIIDLTQSYKMLRFMYGLKMRSPIGKSVMINYGFRYNLDFGVIPFGYPRELARDIRKYQFRNVIAFDLGVTLPF